MEGAISFLLRCLRANSTSILFLWARAGKVERGLEQMVLFLYGSWWPPTPGASESSVSGQGYYQKL